jgi:hypothetical protein
MSRTFAKFNRCRRTMSSVAPPIQQREANPTDRPSHEPKTHPRRQLQRHVMRQPLSLAPKPASIRHRTLRRILTIGAQRAPRLANVPTTERPPNSEGLESGAVKQYAFIRATLDGEKYAIILLKGVGLLRPVSCDVRER